jgi:hypothetical protein
VSGLVLTTERRAARVDDSPVAEVATPVTARISSTAATPSNRITP